MRVSIGDKVKDMVTGYEGIVVSESQWMNRCIRYGVQGRCEEGKNPSEVLHLDEHQVMLITEGEVDFDLEENNNPQRVELGDEVEDLVTGFRGITVSSSRWINNQKRFGVQGMPEQEGKVPPESVFLDDCQIKVLRKGIIALEDNNVQEGENVQKKQSVPTGGPEKEFRHPIPIRESIFNRKD
jgi:hypothetical protein